MKLKRLFLFLLFFVCLYSRLSLAQSCGTCTSTISGYDSTYYTINSGQTLCIDSTGQFGGTLILNGGTICNMGLFTPKVFTITSGTINNYASILLSGDVILGSGLILLNGPQSTANVMGNLTLSGGSINNQGITNISNTLNFSSGSFINSAIMNCQILTGGAVTSITNSGIINQN